jgi:hypothetical protein
MLGSSSNNSLCHVASLLIIVCIFSTGCQSPYYADRGAGLGALAGAGAGAIIGNQTGDAGAGAVIGAGLGALTGAAVGSGMDEMAAQNRAQIAAQMGRQVQAGAATSGEIVSMTQAGVDPMLIENYIRTSGVAQQPTSNDIIFLSQNGVATNVIQAMQAPPVQTVPVVASQQPVIVQEHYYGRPSCYAPHFGYHHGFHSGHHRRRHGTSFGFSVSN